MTELFLKILSMSATAALTAAAVLVLRLILKPAPKIFSYILWTAVFVRLLIPFSLPLPTSELNPITPVTIRTEPYTYDKSFNQAVPLSVGIEAPSEISIYTSETIPEFKAPKTTLEIISVIWLTGVFIMLLRWIYSYLRLRKALKNSRHEEQNIFTSDKISTPFIFGIFPPRIYLPESLSGNRRQLVILHEKYHIKRLDHIAKLVMYLALCIHWFNPVIWLSFRLCEQDMELSCDEAVTGKMSKSEKADYSEALLEAAPKKAVSFTAGFSESGTKRRIKNVLKFKKPALWVMLICALAAVFSVIVLSPDKSKAPENAETRLENTPLTIPIISASPEFLQSVYFGSQLPYLVYANEFNTVFTDGMNGLYLCNDNAVLWAADLSSSFAPYKDKFPFETDAISAGAFTDESGQLRLWCSIGEEMSNHSVKYIIDLETNTLDYIDEIPEDTRNIRTYSYYDFSENASAPLDSHILYYDSDPQNFVYIASNTNSFDLSLIKIVRHTSEGYSEFVPFPEKSPAIDLQSQSKLHFGTYRLENEQATLSSLNVSPLGNAVLSFSPLSSILCIGTAELNSDYNRLIINASDNGRYVFDIEGDSLIYRQTESTEGTAAYPKEMSGAYEGAVYAYSED